MEPLSILIGLIIGLFLGLLVSRLLRASKSGEGAVAIDRFNDVQERLNAAGNDLQKANNQIIDLTAELGKWQERHDHVSEKLTEQKGEMEQWQERFKNDFKVLAQEILDKTGTTFKQQNQEQIGAILLPFKEKLDRFEKKVEETYEKGKAETISLKSEVKMLSEQSAKLAKDAENLTNALKSDVKSQGNWGEVVLERILEKSGLTKNQEYFIQQSIVNEQGSRFQPDVIIQLPEQKNIIIDAKVSLVAYERFATANASDEQQIHLKEHINSIKSHVKGLSEKNYQSLYGVDGLDFVLLFIPIEGAFSLAVQNDNNLFQEAFDKNVVIVSTSTLLATLRTIASIWKQEKQTQNALEIARQGGMLFDKFVNLTEDLLKLGNQMRTAQGTYDDALKKLHSGTGNLVKRAEDLRKLGVKSSKQLDQRLLNRAEDLDGDDLTEGV